MSFDEGRALIIGVGTYELPRLNAPATRADAESVAAALRDAAIAGYRPDRIKVLHDDSATLDGICAELDALATSDPADTVIVFYAGHGLLDTKGEYNLTAHGTKLTPDGKSVVNGTGLTEAVLLSKLRSIRAGKVVLIVNACFSGYVDALGPGGPAEVAPIGAPPTDNLANRVLATGEGRAVLTACRASQQSWILPGAPVTVFGQAISDGLRGKGAVPNAKYVGIWDFYAYVYETTKEIAGRIPRPQEPVMNLSTVVGAFPIALSGAPVSLGAPSADILAAPPPNTAANVVPQAVIDAASSFVPGTTVADKSYGAGIQVINNTKLIDFAGAVVHGGVQIGDVAGGDMIKISIGATPETAGNAQSTADVRSSIESVKTAVAKLAGVDDERGDILRELDDASQAASSGKHERLLMKLDRARELLQGIGPTAPAAVPLSETLSVLMQRARSVGD